MSLKFNIDRPKVSDEEINKQQNFKELVEQFKKQSLKQARGDESWWKDKKIRYSTVIAGVTVVCTITYLSILNKQKNQTAKNDKIATQNSTQKSNLTPKKAAAFITPPHSNLKTSYTRYQVDNAKGARISHPSSTKINIPKNSFVDKNGKSIVGEVTIEYREFHDMADVIVNGIPMAYDSAGKKYNLETAGMFDIKGTRDGEPVFIAPTRSIQVQLASGNDENRFNQYYLDTVARNWNYIQKDQAHKISQASQPQVLTSETKKLEVLKNEIEKVIPRKIDSVQKVYTVKASSLPKSKEPLKPHAPTPGRPTFKLDGSYDEFPELSAFDNVIFEVGPENNNYSKELHEITWGDVKITQGPSKGVNYVLNLKYRSRLEKLVVYPVLSGQDLELAKEQYAKKFESYKALDEKRKADEKRLIDEMSAKQAAYLAEQKNKQAEYERQQALARERANATLISEVNSSGGTMSTKLKANRIFMVSSFGIYNSDCPHEAPKGKNIVPIFVENEKTLPIRPDYIFLVDHTRKTVFNYSSETGIKFKIDPEIEYSICVFSGNKLFICSKEQFREASFSNANKFMVNDLSDKTDHVADLRKALEI